MTLSSALGISTNALTLAQEGITVSSNNLANIDTPGYVRQVPLQESIVVNGVGYGAQINGLSANVDAQLLQNMRDQVTSLGNTTINKTYYNNIQNLYGQPNADNSLSSAIDVFFSSYQNLSNNPETPSLRVAALNAAKDLVNKISTTASGLHNIRLKADREIATDVSTINGLLTDVVGFNAEISKFPENSSGYISIKQKINASLRRISEYINISTTFDSRGKVSISTGNGISLVDDATTAKLEYSQASSVDTFINNGYLNALKVVTLNPDGTDSDTSVNLATDGISSNVNTSLTDGSVYALLQLRDRKIPDLVQQLDTLASALNEQVNSVQNNGYGFPPPASLTGTTTVKSTDEIDFTGSVRIAVINQNGTPATSAYSDETYYRPLTLNLGALDSGQGTGRSTVQTIMNEINDYFGPVQNHAVVGNLRNIRLAAVSDSISDAGTAQFDLELDNTSAKSSTVVISSITVIDPADSTSTYPAATLPATNSYTVAAGDKSRTSQSFTVNFGAGDDNRSSYTVRVRVQVTDADGNISSGDIDYNVSDNVTGIKNNRYNAQAVTNVSGTSQFIAAPGSNSYATVALVDSSGNPVSAGTGGVLKITTPDNRNYSIVIDELDSKEVGVPGAAASAITNRGFSHYFGLNNLLVDHGQISGSAINMAIRSDIQNNANLLSTGQLTLSNQPSDSNLALYTYEAGSGNNKAALDMSALKQKSVYFAAAGSLPTVNITFSGYSADIIGSVSADTLSANNINDSKQLGMDGLLTLFQKQAGVNSDDELSRVIELQNHFSASAQVISIVQQLFNVLNQSLR